MACSSWPSSHDFAIARVSRPFTCTPLAPRSRSRLLRTVLMSSSLGWTGMHGWEHTNNTNCVLYSGKYSGNQIQGHETPSHAWRLPDIDRQPCSPPFGSRRLFEKKAPLPCPRCRTGCLPTRQDSTDESPRRCHGDRISPRNGNHRPHILLPHNRIKVY